MINDMAQEPIKTQAKAAAPAAPAEPAEDAVEKFLSEQKTLEAHRHDLIKEVLRQKEAAIKAFDEKLARLGYDDEHAAKRTHHKDAEKKTPE
jgi:DNA-binding transcriptional MocR family regulator